MRQLPSFWDSGRNLVTPSRGGGGGAKQDLRRTFSCSRLACVLQGLQTQHAPFCAMPQQLCRDACLRSLLSVCVVSSITEQARRREALTPSLKPRARTLPLVVLGVMACSCDAKGLFIMVSLVHYNTRMLLNILFCFLLALRPRPHSLDRKPSCSPWAQTLDPEP